MGLRAISLTAALLTALWVGPAVAGDLTGTYVMVEEGNRAELRLTEQPDGRVEGTLAMDGETLTVQAQADDRGASGTLSGQGEDARMAVTLRPVRGGLLMTLREAEAPSVSKVPGDEELIVFHRADWDTATATPAAPAPPPSPQAAPPQAAMPQAGMPQTGMPQAGMPQAGAPQPGAAGGVVINGRPLGPQQVAEIRQRYGIDPSPGAYWYDARSGLYGVVGYPAFGFMYPGHAYGPLDPNASAGDTNVFMNGRQLPQKEWLVWSQLLGYAIRPGRYWLDGQGNAGTEGSATIQDNLYVAARRNAYRGGGGGTGGGTGGGGDNFWSSRFGRGNWDQGGSRGYVSVPGHGPIGYGF